MSRVGTRISIMAGVLLGLALVAEAQAPGRKVARVGFLTFTP